MSHPGNLPPGIESTVAGLDAADLRRARASTGYSPRSARPPPGGHPADLPAAMAAYVAAMPEENATA